MSLRDYKMPSLSDKHLEAEKKSLEAEIMAVEKDKKRAKKIKK